MQEIDALDWRIKDDTTTRRGDYIRKRATFLADATELEFRRNRWSYQRSEENAHIQGDKKLTLNGGHAAMSLQKTNAHNIAMLLATRSAQGRIILRAQADERGQQHTQAILSPASFSLAHIPSSAQKASARLDMKDAFATMSTNEAKLILEADTACLEGNGSKITCSARGIALEPANGEISLADILFSGNQIKGARNGILTLAGGAIKIAGANAAVQEQGNAPVQAAAQFVREQENAQPEDTLAAAFAGSVRWGRPCLSAAHGRAALPACSRCWPSPCPFRQRTRRRPPPPPSASGWAIRPPPCMPYARGRLSLAGDAS